MLQTGARPQNPRMEESPGPEVVSFPQGTKEKSIEHNKKPRIHAVDSQVAENPQSLPEPKQKFFRRWIQALTHFLNEAGSWFIINLTSALAFVLYRVLNRTRVYGRKNVGHQRNTLILPNHRTMIDSYLVGHITSWPTGWFRPHVLPYHPAAQENFFGNRYIGWFSARWRCIPVRRGVRDFNALKIMTETLPTGHMILFPEGSRSRTGELKKGRPGSGKLINDTGCRVVPCYVKGMDKVLPIGCSFPHFFQNISVIFGKPVPMEDLRQLPDGKETSQKIINRVMDHIGQLKKDLEEIEAARMEKKAARRRAFQKIVSYPSHLFRRLFVSAR